jgi:hypothetical protein
MKRSLRLRPLLKRLLQIAGILIIAQSIVDYRHSLAAAPITAASTTSTTTPNQVKEKVFIASIHWNNEQILRSHWVPALLDLVAHLGKENVYVSVQESGSWDDSKGALRELDEALGKAGVRRRIILDETTHADEIGKTPAAPADEDGWIRTSRGVEELRRVPYLARLRNLVLEPMEELASTGEAFDRVLFVNDVVFTVCTARYTFLPMEFVADVFAPFLSRLKMSSACSIPEGATMRLRARLISPNRRHSTTLSHCETRTAMLLSCNHGLTSDRKLRAMHSRLVSQCP